MQDQNLQARLIAAGRMALLAAIHYSCVMVCLGFVARGFEEDGVLFKSIFAYNCIAIVVPPNIGALILLFLYPETYFDGLRWYDWPISLFFVGNSCFWVFAGELIRNRLATKEYKTVLKATINFFTCVCVWFIILGSFLLLKLPNFTTYRELDAHFSSFSPGIAWVLHGYVWADRMGYGFTLHFTVALILGAATCGLFLVALRIRGEEYKRSDL